MSAIRDDAWVDANHFFGRLAGRLILPNPRLSWRKPDGSTRDGALEMMNVLTRR